MKQFKYYLMAALLLPQLAQDSVPVVTMMMKKVLLILLWM